MIWLLDSAPLASGDGDGDGDGDDDGNDGGDGNGDGDGTGDGTGDVDGSGGCAAGNQVSSPVWLFGILLLFPALWRRRRLRKHD